MKIGANNEVLSEGPEEKGYGYTFAGGRSEMSHKGIMWHTHYKNLQTEHAVRIKTARLS